LHKSLREFEDAERILQMHPQLVELSVSLLKRDLNQESVVNSFKEPMEQYSNIKRLLVWNRCKSLNLEHLNSFISKFNCLKQLEIEANDILINEYPQLQLEELKIFLESVNTFPSVSFFIRGPYFKRGQPPGTIYSRYSRSESIWQSFDKAAEEREIGDSYKKRLRYISNHPTCRELGISIYDDCPAIHNLYYIQAFAPYINKLKIHFNNVSMQRISCVDFLHDIVTQCTVLDSLIILCGDFCRPLAFSTTTNTTLQTLILSKCLIKSPEFFPSLSRTCVGLRQLALSISQSSTNNVELIIMPVTELQQLDLDLEYLRSGIYNISRKALIMINDNSSRKWYFFIKYVNDQYYIVPGKRKMRGGLQVRIEIKKIERLRFFDDDVVGLERIVELS
jgi:hypothetical protein